MRLIRLRQSIFLFVLISSVFGVQGCGSNQSPGTLQTDSDTQGLIYGQDDRKDLYEITDPALRSYANSVGVIVDELFVDGTGDPIEISNKSLAEQKGDWYRKSVCPETKFRDQLQPGSCSGFLISPKIFVTAGHCVDDGIESLRVVMNFSVGNPQQASSKSIWVPRSQVYSFRRIIATKFENAKTPSGDYVKNSKGDSMRIDFAFLELDRPVRGAQPFTVETTPETRVGDPVLVMGHPAGLPLKYADNAHIKSDDGLKFFANVDLFRGNSGSMVMNTRTGHVTGIYTTTSLLPDWTYDPQRNCMMVTQVHDDFGGDAPDEGIVKFTEVLKFLSGSERREIFGYDGGSTQRPTEPQPPHEREPIPGGSGRRCKYKANGDSDYLNDNRNFDVSGLLRIWDGAALEILGNETVYYGGETHEGIRLRVLSNQNATKSYDAKPGDILWTYKSLLTCY